MIYVSDLKVGQAIYSVSMGNGTVMSINNHGIHVQHGGKLWRYNRKLVRSGCINTDLVLRRDDIYLDLDPKDLKLKSAMEEIAIVVKKYANTDQ